MSKIEQQARDSLAALVHHVFKHRDGLIQGVTYGTLAKWIGRLNKHGEGHGRGMGAVLSKMGHLLLDIGDEWGEQIPQIDSLVVQKTDSNQGLPSDGIVEFWPDYPKLSSEEKRTKVQSEYLRIVNFGSRWNEVLVKLDLPKIVALEMPHDSGIAFGCGGESRQHKAFKEYVRQHPEIVGAQKDWDAFLEYALPSMDKIDVVFKSSERCIAVEVKSSVSDGYPSDYERGLYQTIKYGALLKAMFVAGRQDIPQTIQSVLVLESTLPEHYRRLAERLGVTLFENARNAAK